MPGCLISIPKCYASNPSPQAKAENGCDDCPYAMPCLDTHAEDTLKASELVFQTFKYVKPRLNRAAIKLICDTYEGAKLVVSAQNKGDKHDKS